MPSEYQRRGTAAEDQAARFLIKKEFVIIGRNVTSRYGEIDILAQDGKVIVAVEVKHRRSRRFGTAVESITAKKLEKLEAALQTELAKRGWERRPIRIDLVTVDQEGLKHLKSIE